MICRGIDNEQLSRFEREGYLVLGGLFQPKEIAEIRETFMRQNENGPVPDLSDVPAGASEKDGSDPLSFYARMMNPHRRSDLPVGPLAKRYLLDDRLYPIIKALVGEEPAAAQSMFYFKPPKARGQELHQDNFYLRVKPGTCLAAWIAIDDVDAQNGGMKIVPGSQALDIKCPEKADTTVSFTADYVPVPDGLHAVQLDMKAGDVLFFNGSVIHGSTPNTSSDRFRRSLIFHYVPKSTSELATFYTRPLTFDGSIVDIPEAAEGGGPCGTLVAAARH